MFGNEQQASFGAKLKVLVIGADSALAKDYLRALSRDPHIQVFTTGRSGNHQFFLDLQQPQPVLSELQTKNFDLAIVFAAMTNIAACQQNNELALWTNCESVGILMKALQVKSWILLSSNTVFDGSLSACPHHAAMSPENYYGYSKMRMELLAERINVPVAIVRMTKVITCEWTRLQDFLTTVESGNQVKVLTDLVFSPILSSQVSDFLKNLTLAFQPGTYHLSGTEDVSYYDAMMFVLQRFNCDKTLVIPEVSQQNHPKHTTLLVDKKEERLGFKATHWQRILEQIFSFPL